jgi:two-component system, cell cycle sensor histidine kinase and response regulator CckA
MINPHEDELADPRATVVVADDDARVLELMAAMLAAWGYRVLPARGGPQALRLAESSAKPVDLLVTDIEMPEMDGLSLWQNVRCRWPSAKVIFVSGRVRPGHLEGDGLFLEKPFGALDLRRGAESLLRDSRPLARGSAAA